MSMEHVRDFLEESSPASQRERGLPSNAVHSFAFARGERERGRERDDSPFHPDRDRETQYFGLRGPTEGFAFWPTDSRPASAASRGVPPYAPDRRVKRETVLEDEEEWHDSEGDSEEGGESRGERGFAFSPSPCGSARMDLQQLENWRIACIDFDSFLQKQWAFVKEQVRLGIPDCLRGFVWQKLAASRDFLENLPPDTYWRLREIPRAPFDGTILRDVGRTFPKNVLFTQRTGWGQHALFNVVRAYSLFNPEVGYCQGMGFVAGFLLMFMQEEDAFWMIVALLEKYEMSGLFKPGLPLLDKLFYQLECLLEVHLPHLHHHLQRQNVQPSMFASEWFMTLFTANFGLETVARIWDVFLASGWKIIFCVALAIMQLLEESLLGESFEQILLGLKNVKLSLSSDDLINRALSFKISSKNFGDWGEEWSRTHAPATQTKPPSNTQHVGGVQSSSAPGGPPPPSHYSHTETQGHPTVVGPRQSSHPSSSTAGVSIPPAASFPFSFSFSPTNDSHWPAPAAEEIDELQEVEDHLHAHSHSPPAVGGPPSSSHPPNAFGGTPSQRSGITPAVHTANFGGVPPVTREVRGVLPGGESEDRSPSEIPPVPVGVKELQRERSRGGHGGEEEGGQSKGGTGTPASENSSAQQGGSSASAAHTARGKGGSPSHHLQVPPARLLPIEEDAEQGALFELDEPTHPPQVPEGSSGRDTGEGTEGSRQAADGGRRRFSAGGRREGR